MVGLVLVSHSAELAAAVKALAEQQTQGRAAIAAVGGTGEPSQPFGTDAMAILEAIQSVYEEDGVLVLMDLGSAIMSAEMAKEFLEPEQAERVHLCAAPFVEGAMAAAVQASIGMSLEAVAAEAMEAGRPKAEALDQAQPAPVPAVSAAVPADSGGEIVATVTLINHAGLHFGPAVLFVQKAAEYAAEIAIRNLTTGAGPVDARRFNQVLSLGAEQGHTIELAGRGEGAAGAVAALAALARAGFGESIGAPQTPEAQAPIAETPAITGSGRAQLQGLAASSGLAVGVAVLLAPAAQRVRRTTVADPAAEWTRWQAAVTVARAELETLAERMGRELGPEQARIFQAHALALADPDLQGAVRTQIVEQGACAEAAVLDVTEAEAARFRAMEGIRFQERATDLLDVQSRMLRLLDGEGEAALELPDNAIIIAEDLSPSQTAALDRSRVGAFCTALGGPTAHTAILARSMGIPAVVGMGPALLAQIIAGEALAVDGGAGVVILSPDLETQAAYRARQHELALQRQAARAAAQAEARTKDGKRVEVAANLAVAAEVAAALEAGAEGVGLLRTEFLFQDRSEPPSEDEQAAIYGEVARVLAPRPLIIRTLDIGGDKPAPYLNLPKEDNPFLGWRALRISLVMPDFFKTQLRAILRAAVHGNVRVMFPMVATLAEVEQAQAFLAEAAQELAAAGVEHAPHVPTGIMVEIPAAVEIADHLAAIVDFFSIGTNDLTQYTFAVDRTNARVAALADSLHPAVLRPISRVIQAAHAQGKWVGMCGELAGQADAIPVLLGLGLDEFSMSATAIPEAKALLARLTVAETQALAQQALALPDGAAVRRLVKEFLAAKGL